MFCNLLAHCEDCETGWITHNSFTVKSPSLSINLQKQIPTWIKHFVMIFGEILNFPLYQKIHWIWITELIAHYAYRGISYLPFWFFILRHFRIISRRRRLQKIMKGSCFRALDNPPDDEELSKTPFHIFLKRIYQLKTNLKIARLVFYFLWL